jgi:hypothetical protein
MQWPQRHLPRRTHHRSLLPDRRIALRLTFLEIWGSAATPTIVTLQRSTAVRLGHCTIMDALIPFVAALSSVTTSGDVVEACKAGEEGTTKLTAKLGRANNPTATGSQFIASDHRGRIR